MSDKQIVFGGVPEYFIMPRFVASHLAEASAAEVKTAVCICAYPGLSAAEAALRTGLTEQEVNGALSFWRGISTAYGAQQTPDKRRTPRENLPAEASSTQSAATEKSPSRESGRGLHTVTRRDYSPSEIADITASSPNIEKALIECQRILGKTFSAHDAEIFCGGLYDSLSLPIDYILTLATYCKSQGKANLRYMEKMAISLVDEHGVTTCDQLEQYLSSLERLGELETKLRKLFGFEGRTLTKKERELFSSWTEFPFALIEYGYERMIESIGKASAPYLNVILLRWKAMGVTDVDAAKADSEAFKGSAAKPASGKTPGGKLAETSFDFGDFLTAAIKKGES